MRRKRYSLQTVYICIYSNKLTEGVSEPSPNSPTIPSLVVVFETKSLSLSSPAQNWAVCFEDLDAISWALRHQAVNISLWCGKTVFVLLWWEPFHFLINCTSDIWHFDHTRPRGFLIKTILIELYTYKCTWMWIMSLLPSPNQVNQLNLAETNSNLKAFLILITFWFLNAN